MSREGRGGAAMAVFAICAVMGLALICVLGIAGFVGYRFMSNGKKIAQDMSVMRMEMVKERAIAQQQMLTLNAEQDYLVTGIATIVIGNDSTIRMDGKELQLHGIGEAISKHLASTGRNVITAKKIRIVVSPVSSADSIGQVIQSCLRAGITIDQITDSGIVIPPADAHDAHAHATSDAHTDDAHGHDDAHSHDAHDHDEALSHDDAHAHGESDHTDSPATEPAIEVDSAREAVPDDAVESEPPSDGAEATAEAAVETVDH